MPNALRILVVTNHYPNDWQPQRGTFVEVLVREWRRSGVPVLVVAPYGRIETSSRRVRRQPPSHDDEAATVVRPPFTSFSNLRLGPIRTARWGLSSFVRAARRAADRADFAPDVVYSHFMFPAGRAAIEVARAAGRPAVCALGESSFDGYLEQFGEAETRSAMRALDGVLAVSNENRDECVERFGVDPERVAVIPNATDTTRFRPRDRAAMRRELGLPVDRPIVGFVGYFIERKGPLRVLEAIRGLPEVGAFFLGDGTQVPTGDQVLFAGRVTHDEVPKWLSAADLFVFPTLAEGSPNAVIEAMACGLPVVSSDIPALREAVSDDAAILVDPLDPAALRAGIRALLDDPARRARMAHAALERGQRVSVADRAARIAEWLRTVDRH